MRVLFISSGNSAMGISPITYNQGESLKQQGILVDYFTLKGKGIKGYLGNILPLRKKIAEKNYDVIHAHYSLTAFVASLARAKPLVVSLMGSDVKAMPFFKFFIRLFTKYIWQATIVKSKDMKSSLGIKNTIVIPNGVDFNRFKPLVKKVCQEQLGWDITKKHILFAANPERAEKNYQLAKDALAVINNSAIEVHFLKNIPNKEVPLYHNAADVVLLTSLWEGSPNVIKEAMACNRPIVSTNVGDVQWLLKDVKGAYVCLNSVDCIAESIQNAISVDNVDSRNKLKSLELDSKSIALRLKQIYSSVINKSL
jgi:glycosyltransferase involved in cell wall biosynthesis